MKGTAVAGHEGEDPAFLFRIVEDRGWIQEHHILREEILLEMPEQAMDVLHELCEGQVAELSTRVVACHGFQTGDLVFKGRLSRILRIRADREGQRIRDARFAEQLQLIGLRVHGLCADMHVTVTEIMLVGHTLQNRFIHVVLLRLDRCPVQKG